MVTKILPALCATADRYRSFSRPTRPTATMTATAMRHGGVLARPRWPSWRLARAWRPLAVRASRHLRSGYLRLGLRGSYGYASTTATPRTGRLCMAILYYGWRLSGAVRLLRPYRYYGGYYGHGYSPPRICDGGAAGAVVGGAVPGAIDRHRDRHAIPGSMADHGRSRWTAGAVVGGPSRAVLIGYGYRAQLLAAGARRPASLFSRIRARRALIWAPNPLGERLCSRGCSPSCTAAARSGR